jgi:hypothetical protein
MSLILITHIELPLSNFSVSIFPKKDIRDKRTTGTGDRLAVDERRNLIPESGGSLQR